MNELTIYKSGLQLRREVKPEALAGLAPVDRAIFSASVDKTIAEYTDGELTTALIDCLKWIAKDIGYKSATQDDAQYLLVRCVQLLKLYYSNLTLTDFRMAFEMACTGELDEYLPRDKFGQPDRSHYQSFNAEYIGKILGAYRRRRAAALKGVELPKQPEPRNEAEERELGNRAKEELRDVFLRYKYRGRMPYLSNVQQIVYLQLLARVGLSEEYNVGEGEQAAIFAGLIAGLAGKKMQDWERQDALRRLVLKRVFDWMIGEELQIDDYLKCS